MNLALLFILLAGQSGFAQDSRIIYDSRDQLADESFVYTNPTYLFGGHEWPIDASDEGRGTCFVLGFDEFLWKNSPVAKAESVTRGALVVLNPQGQVEKIVRAHPGSKKLSAVHCRDFRKRLKWKD